MSRYMTSFLKVMWIINSSWIYWIHNHICRLETSKFKWMTNVVFFFLSVHVRLCLCIFFQLKSRWFVICCVQRKDAGVPVQISVSRANTSAEERHVSVLYYIMGEYCMCANKSFVVSLCWCIELVFLQSSYFY